MRAGARAVDVSSDRGAMEVERPSSAPPNELSSVGDRAPPPALAAAPGAVAPPSGGSAPRSSAGELFDAVLGLPNDLFKGDREVLRESYLPSRLPHREHQIRQVAEILAPALKGHQPSNLFVYGKIGTGKTAVVAQVRGELERRADGRARVSFVALNCAHADSPYSLLQTIGNAFLDKESERIPTGWSLDRVEAAMAKSIDARGGTVILLLDEVDKLIARGDSVLYTLAELNHELKHARAAIVGISNDLQATAHLDARVKSRLNEEKIVFPPYEAPQLEDILRDRAAEAFREGVLDPGVLPRCAAYAALENGDARRALALLRLAAEMAERDRAKRITVDHVVKAKGRLEQDIILDCCRTLPPHCKILLYAILQLYERRREGLQTGDVYSAYSRLCLRLGLPPLHARSISNYVSELETLGLIRAPTVSRGRGGRTREIVVDVPIPETLPALQDDPLLSALARPRPLNQTILTNFDNPGRTGPPD